jgi:hypothetical protein
MPLSPLELTRPQILEGQAHSLPLPGIEREIAVRFTA